MFNSQNLAKKKCKRLISLLDGALLPVRKKQKDWNKRAAARSSRRAACFERTDRPTIEQYHRRTNRQTQSSSEKYDLCSINMSVSSPGASKWAWNNDALKTSIRKCFANNSRVLGDLPLPQEGRSRCHSLKRWTSPCPVFPCNRTCPANKRVCGGPSHPWHGHRSYIALSDISGPQMEQSN